MSSVANELGLAPAPAGARAAPSRPVDLVHLSRYTLGERALEGEVLALFCTQADLCLERLGAPGGDQEWKEAAHTLKGSARAIGAWRVADTAERAEALSAVLAEDRAVALHELELAVREVQSYIQALLQVR